MGVTVKVAEKLNSSSLGCWGCEPTHVTNLQRMKHTQLHPSTKRKGSELTGIPDPRSHK